MLRTSFYLSLFVVSSLLLLVSCEEREISATMENLPADAVDENIESPKPYVDGELIHRLTVSENHVVEFYQLSDGMTFVHESMPADSNEIPLMDSVEGGANLSDAFMAMRPDAAEVPESLLRADKIREEAAAHFDNRQIAAPLTQQIDSEAQHLAGDYSAQLNCSPDYYQDGWGEQWFLNNYCIEGMFRMCDGNWTAMHVSGAVPWYKWTGMAADFWYGAQMFGGYTQNGTYRPYFSFPVQPRYINWVYFNPGTPLSFDVHIEGDFANCPRVHYAFSWNQ